MDNRLISYIKRAYHVIKVIYNLVLYTYKITNVYFFYVLFYYHFNMLM